MNILLDKDLILKFLCQNIESSEHQGLIKKIFTNENSKFVYSRKFLEYIKEELHDEDSDLFNALFTKLSDSGCNIASSETSSSFDEEIIHVYKNLDENVFVSIFYNEPSVKVAKEIPNIAIVSKTKKNNYHWIVTQLAVLHPNKVTVSCLDFSENHEIDQFFKDVFSIPRNISRMNIFDRQTSQFNHKKFDSFKKKTSVFYYTFEHSQFLQDEPTIKSTFKKVKIHTTRKRNDVHSRKLIFEGFILTSHHDFNEVLIDSDWEVDILFSNTEAIRWMKRCNKFREKH